jgi:phosphomevalonate kinase
MRVAVSAPGKLILLGEYAVLYGHPALVAAVDRRARVILEPSEDELCGVRAPGLLEGLRRFRLADDGRMLYEGGGDPLPLVTRLLRSMIVAELVTAAALAPFEATLDTRGFFDEAFCGHVKLGLGSSAALTVALAEAVLEWAGIERPGDRPIEWLERLLELHRSAQGGRGSGVDLAASLLGGVVEYRLSERGSVRWARQAEPPSEVGMLALFTGRAAETGHFLERLEHAQGLRPESVGRALSRLGTTSGAGIEALHQRRSLDFLQAVEAYWSGLQALAEAADIEILSREHLKLHRLAARCGAVYKPSGAGGGDVGVAFARDPSALEALSHEALEAGARPVDLAVDYRGVRREME